jgi:hypothetical protein
MTEELKACPWCGDQPIRNGRLGAGGVLCADPTHRAQTYGADQASADAAWNSRPTPADPGEVREKVARIIDPVVFKSWQSMIEHCEAVGDGDEAGLRYANATYLKTMEEARAKADAILQVTNCLETGNGSKSFREGVEAAAKVAESLSLPQIANLGERLPSPGATIATAIRALASGEG